MHCRILVSILCILLSIICGSCSAYCLTYDIYGIAGCLFVVYLVSSLYAFYDIMKCGGKLWE